MDESSPKSPATPAPSTTYRPPPLSLPVRNSRSFSTAATDPTHPAKNRALPSLLSKPTRSPTYPTNASATTRSNPIFSASPPASTATVSTPQWHPSPILSAKNPATPATASPSTPSRTAASPPRHFSRSLRAQVFQKATCAEKKTTMSLTPPVSASPMSPATKVFSSRATIPTKRFSSTPPMAKLSTVLIFPPSNVFPLLFPTPQS